MNRNAAASRLPTPVIFIRRLVAVAPEPGFLFWNQNFFYAGEANRAVLQGRVNVEAEARSEPPTSAPETVGGRGAVGPSIGQSPVRYRRGPSPRTPRTGGNFAVGVRYRRAVSAAAD